MKEIGLYVHIPFCKKKCLYCDFNSYESHDENNYIEALCKELNNYINEGNFIFKTVFIGGGTPTFIKWQNIKRIMELIRPHIKKDGEITIECNPESMSEESIKEYYEMGINRLSIGLQAIQNNLLKSIGRIHNYEDFINSYALARNQGFKNINIDLMFSLPGQTFDMWHETIERVCNLKPEHISCYSLIIEETTPIHSLIKTGKLTLPDEDTDREMYHLAINTLSQNGYKQYEISNFAKDGHECLHNLIYWKNEEYLGVGAGSHSKIKLRRFWNTKGINEYIKNVKNNETCIDGFEDISKDEDIWETIFLNLRLNEGLNIAKFNKKYKKDFMFLYKETIDELLEEKLLIKNGENIALTDKGRDISNYVFIKFSNF